MKLSAVIITFNEEKNILRCLTSLSFCDEILVLDAESTDKTRELAAAHGVKVVSQPWLGYINQRNLGVSMANSAWILSVDADEEVSDELREEILGALASPQAAAYSIPRKTIHLGRWIRYGGWYPNRLVRLFDKSKGKWVGNELHEYWETSGKEARLSGHLLHYSFTDFSDQIERNNQYSSLGARALQNRGVRFSITGLLVKSTTKFLETYFLKLGFRDGIPGFIISVSAAYSVFSKWAKLWELETGEKKAIGKNS